MAFLEGVGGKDRSIKVHPAGFFRNISNRLSMLLFPAVEPKNMDEASLVPTGSIATEAPFGRDLRPEALDYQVESKRGLEPLFAMAQDAERTRNIGQMKEVFTKLSNQLEKILQDDDLGMRAEVLRFMNNFERTTFLGQYPNTDTEISDSAIPEGAILSLSELVVMADFYRQLTVLDKYDPVYVYFFRLPKEADRSSRRFTTLTTILNRYPGYSSLLSLGVDRLLREFASDKRFAYPTSEDLTDPKETRWLDQKVKQPQQ